MQRDVVAVEDTRRIDERARVLNGALPRVAAAPAGCWADGELLVCDPAERPRLARRCWLG